MIKALESKSNKKLRRRGNKKQRKISQKKAETRCRKERKMLHKKCSKIATCCSTAELCHTKTSSINDQIIELKTNLRENRAQCKKEL